MNTKNILLIILGAIIAVPLSVSALSVFTPSQGGTGNGNIPTYGQILVGNGSAYTLTATSSLGLPTNATLANYLTLSAWYATTTGGLAEGSNLYYTSARATSSFNSLIGALDKGYFFSTTSADYWHTTKTDVAFSTTSADYWISLKPLGSFWSTTSADYWDGTKSRWSTTSSDYWLTTKSTSNLTEGSNLYYTDSRVQTFLNTLAKGYFWSTTSADAWGASKSYITLSSLSASAPIVYNSGTGAFSWTGLATTSQPASSNVLVSNGTNGVYGVATSTLSATSPLTGSFVHVGSSGSLGIQVANGSQNGYLSSGDWTTFNGKESALTFTYPLSRSVNTISLAFGTTTSNLWAGKQTFTNAPIFSSLTGLLKGNGAGELTVAANGTDFTLITAKTCGAGEHMSQVTAGGVFTCSADTGSAGGASQWATSTLFSNMIHTAGAYGIGIGTTTPLGALSMASSSAVTSWWNHTGAAANKKLGYISFANGVFDFGTSTDAGATSSRLRLDNGTTTIGSYALTVGNGTASSSLVAGAGTSTPNGGVDISTGCFAVLGTCIGSGGTLTGAGTANRVAFWTSANNVSYDNAFVWDNTNKRLGIGSTTPWGVFSIIDPIGGAFQPGVVTATSTVDLPFFGWTASTSAAAGSEIRILAGNPTDYLSHGDTFDQFLLDGRLNTKDWKTMECANDFNSKTAQITSDITGSVMSTTLGKPCGDFSYIEDANGVADQVVTTGSGYIRLRPGATGAINAAGDGMALAGTTAFLRAATNTPVMEVIARPGASQQASSTFYMMGFSAATGVSADWASDAQNGCFFVASSTKANWQAVCRSTTATIVDTGVASSSVTTGDGVFRSFRVELHNLNGTNYAVFRIKSAKTSAWVTVATISTTMPSAVSLNPIVSVGKSTAGISPELHVNRVRVWYNDPLWY